MPGVMRVHPSDLQTILKAGQLDVPNDSVGRKHLAGINGFLRICEEIEPDLVWNTDDDRLNWLLSLEYLRFMSSEWQSLDRESRGRALETKYLHQLRDLADRAWRGPSQGKVRELPFIRDAGLRAIAERDLASLASCRKSEEVKLVLILAGSIVEAALLDAIQSRPDRCEAAARKVQATRIQQNPRVWKGFNPATPESWKLIHMVGVCGPDGEGMLGERTVRSADLVRDWRNFVHPLKELDETRNAPLKMGEAALVEALVDLVLEDLEARSQTGRTAP